MYVLYHRIGGKQIHSDEYDAVIGYDESMARLISYFPAKKRINWVHCDYKRFAQGRDETKYYDKIDTVVCVSTFVKGVFSEIYPRYAEKVFAIHNVINVEDIRKKAQENIDDKRFTIDAYTIVSCGRLDPVKQFSLIPRLAAQLKEKKTKPFKWYIIGGGNDNEQR
jgi:glycosyltransferase involved in cell wall biosynthesis